MKNPNLWQVAEVRLTYRTKPRLISNPKVSASVDAEKIFRENWSKDIELVEEGVALFLFNTGEAKALFRVSRGGTKGTVIDFKILFAAAIKSMAASIILAHNHPSGNIAPSEADKELTRKLRQAGDVLQIPVLDHLILAPHKGFFSFADEGYL